MIVTDFVRCTECQALNEPRALFCSRCGASLYGPAHGGIRRKRRRVTLTGAVMALALLLLLGITVFVLGVIIQGALEPGEEIDSFSGQSGTTATIGAGNSAGSGGAGSNTSSSLATGVIRPTSSNASSTLDATSTNSYRVTNLVDGDLATAWNEGAEGAGLGEWVRFEFSRQMVLTRIEIANGYQKDDERFLGNPRVRSLKVEYSNGTTQLVDLLDTKQFQAITPTGQPVEWVKLIIVSVYAGDEWEDTALSEVRVYARPN
ncbi:MAG: hypothetical protein A2133_01995 [Actinobacteria bacterium RBG_16_64_13]|nr:MAG: hypothetical protein A2133_01995 [Actinobacteria bacterium RBG_16_64_13]